MGWLTRSRIDQNVCGGRNDGWRLYREKLRYQSGERKRERERERERDSESLHSIVAQSLSCHLKKVEPGFPSICNVDRLRGECPLTLLACAAGRDKTTKLWTLWKQNQQLYEGRSPFYCAMMVTRGREGGVGWTHYTVTRSRSLRSVTLLKICTSSHATGSQENEKSWKRETSLLVLPLRFQELFLFLFWQGFYRTHWISSGMMSPPMLTIPPRPGHSRFNIDH